MICRHRHARRCDAETLEMATEAAKRRGDAEMTRIIEGLRRQTRAVTRKVESPRDEYDFSGSDEDEDASGSASASASGDDDFVIHR